MDLGTDLRQRLALYVITDRSLAGGRPEEEVVRQAIAGGATAIQLRGKDFSGGELYAAGLRLREITRRAGVLFFVNDRVDVAVAVGADGVHVGQEDLPVPATRRILGRGRLLGVSASTLEEARRAEEDGADYIGFGAVYPTQTKADVCHSGLEELRRVAAEVRVPVVAIGGIKAANAPEVLAAGAHGLAVVSAVVAAPDVRAAAAEFAAILRGAKVKGDSR